MTRRGLLRSRSRPGAPARRRGPLLRQRDAEVPAPALAPDVEGRARLIPGDTGPAEPALDETVALLHDGAEVRAPDGLEPEHACRAQRRGTVGEREALAHARDIWLARRVDREPVADVIALCDAIDVQVHERLQLATRSGRDRVRWRWRLCRRERGNDRRGDEREREGHSPRACARERIGPAPPRDAHVTSVRARTTRV